MPVSCPSRALRQTFGHIIPRLLRHPSFHAKLFNLKSNIAITAIASVSALGNHPDEIWRNYLSEDTCISYQAAEGEDFLLARIPAPLQAEIQQLRQADPNYLELDDCVLYAIFVARQATRCAGWDEGASFGINLGSSRGATHLFEKYYREFLQNGSASKLASPSTTLGNISSWVAHDLKAQGPEISHSVTCSTALHAMLNALAWLGSGMETQFLAGGSEAPLTAFTLHQMRALKIYAQLPSTYPCRALDLAKTRNSMVLGEGAAVACLEIGARPDALAYIASVGYASDEAHCSTAISTDARCFQKSMKMALGTLAPGEIDAIVMHAPGTILGDASEWRAIEKVFGNQLPMLTSNKWKIGHTLGASGMLSLQLAVLMMQHQHFIPVPYIPAQKLKKQINKILVNAVGFGGNAVSILLSR
jgi:3-oxoacyl-[acyl-carrier-protein] synthase II